MEISGINSSLPFAFTMPDKDDSGSTPAAVQETAADYAAQLGLVNADCQVLLSDDAEELLNEAGCADVNTDWSEQTAGVLGLVMAAAGVEN